MLKGKFGEIFLESGIGEIAAQGALPIEDQTRFVLQVYTIDGLRIFPVTVPLAPSETRIFRKHFRNAAILG